MLVLALLLSIDPLLAARRAHDEAAQARVLETYDAIDVATEDSDLRIELRRICARESWCNRFGQVTDHPEDSWAGARMWRRAVARGWLEPDECPEHVFGNGGRWAPRGILGMSPAYALRLIEGRNGGCLDPTALDDPYYAAEAGVEYVDHLCEVLHACTCESRTRWWMGPGVWSTRSPRKKLAAVERQCGERGLISSLVALTRYALSWS